MQHSSHIRSTIDIAIPERESHKRCKQIGDQDVRHREHVHKLVKQYNRFVFDMMIHYGRMPIPHVLAQIEDRHAPSVLES
jgi:hypothetical protein